MSSMYGGYDVGALQRLAGAPCDAVCHCASCLWRAEEWGFA